MSEHLTVNDYRRSCTSSSLSQVIGALEAAVDGNRPQTLLDVGCGFGGIAASISEALHVPEVHGVDVDDQVMVEARNKGVDAIRVDVGASPLPYQAGAFDLLTCFGMLDYLPWYDVAVREFSRVLAPAGLVAIALPNLASWHNRLALLLGYQPRDVEFCSLQTVGLAPLYKSANPVGHIHTPTTRAFREFMSLMGFDEVRTHALRPMNKPVSRSLKVVDAVVGRFPSASRRFLYIGRRRREPVAPSSDSWWSSDT